MKHSEIQISLLMLVAGLLGGTISFFIQREENETWMPWAQHVAIACGASFLTPLFLNTISSQLVADVMYPGNDKDKSDTVFVFFGFCMIASMSARSFINTLTEKVLKETKAAKKELKEAQAEIHQISSAITPFVESDDKHNDATQLSIDVLQTLNPASDELKVLSALTDPTVKFTLRAISGIAKDTDLSRETVHNVLSRLQEKGWASQVVGSKGERWIATVTGKQIAQYFAASQTD